MHTLENLGNAHEKFICTPQCVTVLDELEKFMLQAKRGAEARIGSLRGPSRVGKSTIAKMLLAKYPSVMQGDIKSCPVVYMEVPGKPTYKGLLTAILEKLGAKSLRSDPSTRMIERIAYFVKKLDTRLLILDEFQHLHRVHGISREGLYDSIKTILNKCGCPILAVGVEDSISVIDSDVQLQGRCIYRRLLRPFQSPEVTQGANAQTQKVAAPSFQEFRGVIRQLVATYNFSQASNLDSFVVARKLYLATDGLFGRLTDVIDRAALEAQWRALSHITNEMVDLAIEVSRGDLDAAIQAVFPQIDQNPMTGRRSIRTKDSRTIAALEQSARNMRLKEPVDAL